MRNIDLSGKKANLKSPLVLFTPSTSSRPLSLSLSTTMSSSKPVVDGKISAVETDSDTSRRILRRRWELASVLNFLQVFEPVLESKMKISAEEIETALITPNGLLAQLHITLLKGIPPVSKTLNGLDAWVTALCKKLTTWWPCVAEGDIPITVAKGEEISRYKELESTTRLLLLKALCEIRAEQHDIVSHVNDALKNKIEVSTFRKDMIGGDGIKVAYWFDGNPVIGYRLYKESIKFEPIGKGKKCLPLTISDWEILATNFDEFHKLVDEFSSSGSKVEVAVGRTVEADFIPIIDKLQKKKEKVLRQQKRQDMLINGFRHSGIARSCRSRTSVTYTFDAYDKAIDEAIQVTNERKTTTDLRKEKKQGDGKETNKIDSKEFSGSDIDSEKSSANTQESTESDSERELRDSHVESENDSEEDDEAYNEDDSFSSGSEMTKKEIGIKNKLKENPKNIHRHFGSRWSSRLAGNANHSVLENKAVAKNRSRQRLTRNSALECTMIPDSEDEQLSDDGSHQSSGSKDSQ